MACVGQSSLIILVLGAGVSPALPNEPRFSRLIPTLSIYSHSTLLIYVEVKMNTLPCSLPLLMKPTSVSGGVYYARQNQIVQSFLLICFFTNVNVSSYVSNLTLWLMLESIPLLNLMMYKNIFFAASCCFVLIHPPPCSLPSMCTPKIVFLDVYLSNKQILSILFCLI